MAEIIGWTAVGFIVLGAVGFIVGLITAEDVFLGAGIVTAIVSGIILLICAGIADSRNNTRLMSQCMASGKQEFECVAMLKRNDTVIPIPIIIPSGR